MFSLGLVLEDGQIPTFWLLLWGSHVPNRAMPSYTSNIPQNCIGNNLGFCIILKTPGVKAGFQKVQEDSASVPPLSQWST